MNKRIHLMGAVAATLCIAIFFISTLSNELFGSKDAIATIKGLIVAPGLFILVPAIVATGGSGFLLSKNRKGRLISAKKKRMPIIGANGVLILLPAAIALDHWASSGSFHTGFYLVQGLELVAGAINLTLMGMNIHDGLNMTGRLRLKNPQAKISGVF